MEMNFETETRVVEIPEVGTLFRRERKAPGGESLQVEYLRVVYGEVMFKETKEGEPVLVDGK